MSASRPEVLPAELLDGLPSDSIEARASRRDLRIFNSLLGTAGWMRSALTMHGIGPADQVLELGAGDGCLGREMHARGSAWDGLDRAGRPPSWPRDADWIQSDVFDHVFGSRHRVVAASLFLHHFSDEQLPVLGKLIQEHARLLIVADLWRSASQEKIFGLVCRLMRAHPVSRHDGALSIRAGFRGEELPHALGLAPGQWRWKISRTFTGAYRMIATKRP